MDEKRNLGDLFRAWTEWTGWAFSVTIIALSVLGLAMSLSSFIRIANHVKEHGGDNGPWGHILSVMIGGLISVSGLVYGFASLLWVPI